MKKKMVDINCDMGEAFGMWSLSGTSDIDIFPMITSANIASGFHAGDPNVMSQTVLQAVKHNVGIGVHPGYNDLQGFGRRSIKTSNDELINDIIYQIGALSAFAAIHGQSLSHVKPHGALYMDMSGNEDLSLSFIQAMQKLAPKIPVLCLSISKTYRAAISLGHPVICEFYADRDYDSKGNIIFTRKSEKLNPQQVAQKVLKACQHGVVNSIDGEEIEIQFDSICFHSDAPGCVENIKQTKVLLEANDIKLQGLKNIEHTNTNKFYLI